MARKSQTAEERTRFNREMVAEASAALGRKVSIRQAAAYRREQRAKMPAEVGYRVQDRVLDFDAADCRRLGQVIAKVVDYKIVRDGVALFAMKAAGADFGHILTDASLVSQSHPLLVTLDELYPRDDGDGG